jgi:hypothetical protein
MLCAMGAFEDVLTRYAALPETALSAPWRWPGHEGGELEVRDAVLRSLELEHAALARSRGRAGEVASAVAEAQAAFGDLRGLLCGQPDDLLDAEPGDGEWTLRRTLQHVLWVERRYQIQTGFAARRSDDDPVRIEPEVGVEDAPTVADWVERLAAVRAGCRALLAIPEGRMTRPTVWAGHGVDVRFRLHRFTGHLAQHTIQCDKALARLGRAEAEPRRLARLVSAARGGHELLSDDAVLRDLDGQHAALAGSIAR